MDKLDKISDGLISHLQAEVNKGTSDANTPLEAVMKLQKNRTKRQVAGPSPSVLEIDGFFLYEDSTTLMLFKLTQLKNPDVDKVLVEANFSMFDINGKQIFPRPTPPTP